MLRIMRKVLGGLLVVSVVAALGAWRARAQEGGESSSPACVTSRGEARYGAFGYDHVVLVRNGCEYPVSCRISTNVNTTPTTVSVAAGEESSTVTFRGSPARAFQPNVQCRRKD